MNLYLFIWILVFFLTFFGRINTIYKQIWFFLILLVLIFIAGGRSLDVGIDTNTYFLIYKDIGNNGYVGYLEPIWNLLNIIPNYFKFSYNGFLTFISALTLIPVFSIAKKVSPNPYLSILVYISMHIYTGSFNATRQYLALSWILVSYYYLFRKKIIWALFFALISTLIHYSSVFCFAGLFFYKFFKLNKKKILLFILLSFLIGCVMNDSLLSKFAFLYENYVDNGAYRDSKLFAYIFTLLVDCFGVYLLFTIKENTYKTVWTSLYFLSLLILNLTFQIQYGIRIYVIFSISQIIFFPIYIRNCKPKYKKLANPLIYTYLFVIFLRMLLSNANEIYPYSNVWF